MSGIGALLALFLIADALGLAGGHPVYGHNALRGVYQLTSALAAMAALALAAWFLKWGLEEPPEGKRHNRVLYLVLAGMLILCAAAVTVRLGVLVRATSRAPEDHFPIGVTLIGFVAGLLLFLIGKSKVRRAGLFFLFLVPVFMVFAFILGLQVDFLAVTEARARRLGQAVEDYRLKQGTYPTDLGALTPNYLAMILGPLTGRGQVWCYQADLAGYRLGYAFFQRYYDWGDGVTLFYEPYFAIKTPQTGGQPPQGPWMCDQELELLKIHHGL